MSQSSKLSITSSTRYCAVFGQPIRHSASPAMHNAALLELGLNWRYLAFEVAPNQLRTALEGCRSMGFMGVNLTVPHKLLAVEMMDELDETARRWGAVNTVSFESKQADGSWRPLGQSQDWSPSEVRMVGYNTDADAIVRSLKEDLDCEVKGKSVLLLGAGGAGRVAALRLAQAGAARMHLVNRTVDKAERLAGEIRVMNPSAKVFAGYPGAGEEVDLVLNATSLGLKADDALPLDPAIFDLKRARCAYDMIYRPAKTPFLLLAESKGVRVANGLGMLLHQGAKALEIWTGRSAPLEAMKSALLDNVYGGVGSPG